MKYDTGHLVGRGGMGVVYRSWDPRLERPVALKVLHRDGDEAVQRMLREAKAQAGVAHPNICPVYEVGVLDRRPYIAMRWIDGVPLDEAVAGLPLERKVHLFATVVEAVQAAHAAGLVHRDLKPANVLVERSAEGDLEPFVLDFGIARSSAGEPALTRTGQVVGTPGYLSPEQARGDRDLDRRSDVFALGCVLYELLAGAPPFRAVGAEALVQVLEHEPAPLRRVAPGVPRDLATIVATCLEKERERRYGSARELADDLRRFLAGEPIRARPVGVLQRLDRRARRHPVAAGAIVTALVAVLSLGSLAAHSRATAAERARLAQRFGREIERIDSGLRLAHLGALHDIRPQKEALRLRLSRLEDELPELGEAARGPGAFALGSGHLSLGDPRRALEHLERAWDVGYREPEVTHALALALGALYEQGLADLARLDDPAVRAARRRDLARRYRDRAVALLREAGRADGSPVPLLEARLALYEERYEEAAELAEAAAAAEPWRYEAHLVHGDAIAADAIAGDASSEPRDEDVESLLARLAAADAAYARAASEGRSDPRVHEKRCALWLRATGVRFFGPGGDLEPKVQAAAEACRRSLAADPGRGRPRALLSRLWVLESRDRNRGGEDPMPVIDRAVEAGRRAVRLDPRPAEHHRSLGDALGFRAEFERERGLDPTETLREAVERLEHAIDLEPWDAASHNGLGLVQWELVLRARSRGEDQRPHLDAATAAFRRATEIVPAYARAHSNLGSIYNLRIEYEAAHGIDPSRSLEAAAHAFRRAIDADPSYVYAYNNLGNVYRHRGEAALERGRDPEADLREAERWFRRAAERNPEWSYPHFNVGLALHDLARWRVETGGDPTPELDGAAEAFRQGLAIKPDLPRGLRSAALVELLRARHRVETGESPAAVLAAAQALLDRADRLDPDDGFGLELRGALELVAARAPELRTEAGAEAHFEAAEASLARAVERVPDSATGYQRLAEVHWRRAAWERGRGGRPDRIAEIIARGLDAAERALALNPTAADVEAIRGELHRLAAESGGDGAEGSRAAAEAALRRALDLKPSLAHRHGASLDWARVQRSASHES